MQSRIQLPNSRSLVDETLDAINELLATEKLPNSHISIDVRTSPEGRHKNIAQFSGAPIDISNLTLPRITPSVSARVYSDCSFFSVLKILSFLVSRERDLHINYNGHRITWKRGVDLSRVYANYRQSIKDIEKLNEYKRPTSILLARDIVRNFPYKKISVHVYDNSKPYTQEIDCNSFKDVGFDGCLELEYPDRQSAIADSAAIQAVYENLAPGETLFLRHSSSHSMEFNPLRSLVHQLYDDQLTVTIRGQTDLKEVAAWALKLQSATGKSLECHTNGCAIPLGSTNTEEDFVESYTRAVRLRSEGGELFMPGVIAHNDCELASAAIAGARLISQDKVGLDVPWKVHVGDGPVSCEVNGCMVEPLEWLIAQSRLTKT